jgi:7-cyano-7-deazaguanine synthase
MASESFVILCSGGVNSTAAAARAARNGTVNLLHVDYGHPSAGPQRAAVEAIGRALGAQRVLGVEMPHVRLIASARRGVEAADPSGDIPAWPPPMPSLLDAAFQWAARITARAVVVGASQVADEAECQVGAGQGTPHRRREFFHACEMMFDELRSGRPAIRLEAPLIGLTRSDIIKLGRRFGAPLESCWCCECAGPHVCGQCPGCRALTAATEPILHAEPAAAGR